MKDWLKGLLMVLALVAILAMQCLIAMRIG